MKKIFICCVGLLLMLMSTACGSAPKKAETPAKPEPVKMPDAQITAIAKGVVSKMTLEEKIGQMMIVGVDGTSVDDNAVYLLKKMHVGGIILFDKNMSTKAQVRGLTANLQSLADDKGLPLFMCLDQEGGNVTRMKQSLYTAPTAASIAAGGNPQMAYDEAKKTAIDIKNLGFNVDFAPVVDVNSMYQRSYGTTPAQVVQFAGQACKAYEDTGLIYSLKHFPGIGKAKLDTHLGMSTVEASKDTIIKEDYQPFKELIHTYPNDDFMVMTGHLKYSAFGDLQASVNPKVLKDLLRKDAGFTGIAITDDMGMGALMQGFTPAEAGVKAVQGGQDILLVCHGQEPKLQVYDSVLKAAQNGTIAQADIDASVTRIITSKLKNLVSYRQLSQFADTYTK
jgi:beta-N-acetylhexosaminidase